MLTSALEGIPPYMIQHEPRPALLQQLESIVTVILSSPNSRESKQRIGVLRDFIIALVDEGQVPCFVLGQHLCCNIIVVLIEKHLKLTLFEGKSTKTSVREEVCNPFRHIIESLHAGLSYGSIVVPFLWKSGTPLRLVLAHILQVLQSEAIVPLCGRDYANVLTNLLQYDQYQAALTTGEVWEFASRLLLLVGAPMHNPSNDLPEWIAYAAALSAVLASPPAIPALLARGELEKTIKWLCDISGRLHTEKILKDETLQLQMHLVCCMRLLASKCQYDHGAAVLTHMGPFVKRFLGYWHLCRGRDGWRIEVSQFCAIVLSCQFSTVLAGLWKGDDAGRLTPIENPSANDPTFLALVNHPCLATLHEQVYPVVVSILDSPDTPVKQFALRELRFYPCVPMQPLFDLASITLFLTAATKTAYLTSQKGVAAIIANVDDAEEDDDDEVGMERSKRPRVESITSTTVSSVILARISKGLAENIDPIVMWLQTLASPLCTAGLQREDSTNGRWVTKAESTLAILLQMLKKRRDGQNQNGESVIFAAATSLLSHCSPAVLQSTLQMLLPIVIPNEPIHSCPPPSSQGIQFIVHLLHTLRARGVFHIVLPHRYRVELCPYFLMGGAASLDVDEAGRAVAQYSSLLSHFLVEISSFSCSTDAAAISYNAQPTQAHSALLAAVTDASRGKRPREEHAGLNSDTADSGAFDILHTDGGVIAHFDPSQSTVIATDFVLRYLLQGAAGAPLSTTPGNHANAVVDQYSDISMFQKASGARRSGTRKTVVSTESPLHIAASRIGYLPNVASCTQSYDVPVTIFQLQGNALKMHKFRTLLRSLGMGATGESVRRKYEEGLRRGSAAALAIGDVTDVTSSSKGGGDNTSVTSDMCLHPIPVVKWYIPSAASDAVLVEGIFSCSGGRKGSSIDVLSRMATVDGFEDFDVTGGSSTSSIRSRSMRASIKGVSSSSSESSGLGATSLELLSAHTLAIFDSIAAEDAQRVASTQKDDLLSSINANHTTVIMSTLALRELLHLLVDGAWSISDDPDDISAVASKPFTTRDERTALHRQLTSSGGITLVAVLLLRTIASCLKRMPIILGTLFESLRKSTAPTSSTATASTSMMESVSERVSSHFSDDLVAVVVDALDQLEGMLSALRMLVVELTPTLCQFDLLSWEPQRLMLGALNNIVSWVSDTFGQLSSLHNPELLSMLSSTRSSRATQAAGRAAGSGASRRGDKSSMMSQGRVTMSTTDSSTRLDDSALYLYIECVRHSVIILSELHSESLRQCQPEVSVGGSGLAELDADDTTPMPGAAPVPPVGYSTESSGPTVFKRPLIAEKQFLASLELILSNLRLNTYAPQTLAPVVLLHIFEPLAGLIVRFDHNDAISTLWSLCETVKVRYIDTHLSSLANVVSLVSHPLARGSTLQDLARAAKFIQYLADPVKAAADNAATAVSTGVPAIATRTNYNINDGARCSLAHAQGSLVRACEGKQWGVELGRLLFATTGSPVSFAVRYLAATYSAIPFTLFAKRHAVLQELVIHVHEAIRSNERSKCATALLALAMAGITAPTVEGDVVSFLLEVSALSHFKHGSLVKDTLGYMWSSSRTLTGNASAAGSVIHHSPIDSLLPDPNKVNASLQSNVVTTHARALVAQHISRVRFDWVWKSNYSLDAFPAHLVGFDSQGEFITAHVAALLPLAILAKHKVQSGVGKGGADSGGALAWASSAGLGDIPEGADIGDSTALQKIADVFRRRIGLDGLLRDNFPEVVGMLLLFTQLGDGEDVIDLRVSAQRSLEWVKVQLGQETFTQSCKRYVEPILISMLSLCRSKFVPARTAPRRGTAPKVPTPQTPPLPHVPYDVIVEAVRELCSLIDCSNFLSLFSTNQGDRVFQVISTLYGFVAQSASIEEQKDLLDAMQGMMIGCFGASVLKISLALEVCLHVLCVLIGAYPHLRKAACQCLTAVWRTVWDSHPKHGPATLSPYYQIVSASLGAHAHSSPDVARCFTFITTHKAIGEADSKLASALKTPTVAPGRSSQITPSALRGGVMGGPSPSIAQLRYNEPSQMLLAYSQGDALFDQGGSDEESNSNIRADNDAEVGEGGGDSGSLATWKAVEASIDPYTALQMVIAAPGLLEATGSSVPPAHYLLSLAKTIEEASLYLTRAILEDVQTCKWDRSLAQGMSPAMTKIHLAANAQRRRIKGGHKALAPSLAHAVGDIELSTLDRLQSTAKYLCGVAMRGDFPLAVRTAALDAFRALTMCFAEAGAEGIVTNAGGSGYEGMSSEPGGTSKISAGVQHGVIHPLLADPDLAAQCVPVTVESCLFRGYEKVLIFVRSMCLDPNPHLMKRASVALRFLLDRPSSASTRDQGVDLVKATLLRMKEHNRPHFDRLAPFIQGRVAYQNQEGSSSSTDRNAQSLQLQWSEDEIVMILDRLPNLEDPRLWNSAIMGATDALVGPQSFIGLLTAVIVKKYLLPKYRFISRFLPLLLVHPGFAELYFPVVVLQLSLQGSISEVRALLCEKFEAIFTQARNVTPQITKCILDVFQYLRVVRTSVTRLYGHRGGPESDARLDPKNSIFDPKKELAAANRKFVHGQMELLATAKEVFWFTTVPLPVVAAAAAHVEEWAFCAMLLEMGLEGIASTSGLSSISSLEVFGYATPSTDTLQGPTGTLSHVLVPRLARDTDSGGRVLKGRAKLFESLRALGTHFERIHSTVSLCASALPLSSDGGDTRRQDYQRAFAHHYQQIKIKASSGGRVENAVGETTLRSVRSLVLGPYPFPPNRQHPLMSSIHRHAVLHDHSMLSLATADSIGDVDMQGRFLTERGCSSMVVAVAQSGVRSSSAAEAAWRCEQWENLDFSNVPQEAGTMANAHVGIFNALRSLASGDSSLVRTAVSETQETLVSVLSSSNILQATVIAQALREVSQCSRLNSGRRNYPPFLNPSDCKANVMSGNYIAKNRLDACRRTLGVGYNFEVMEPLLAVRSSICSILNDDAWRAQCLHDISEKASLFGTPTNTIRPLQWLSTFLDTYTAGDEYMDSAIGNNATSGISRLADTRLGTDGAVQISSGAAATILSPSFVVNRARLHWAVGDARGAIDLLRDGISRVTAEATPESIESSEMALCLLARWSFDAQILPTASILEDKGLREALQGGSPYTAFVFGHLCDSMLSELPSSLFAERRQQVASLTDQVQAILGITDVGAQKVGLIMFDRQKELGVAKRELLLMEERCDRYSNYALSAYILGLCRSKGFGGVAGEGSDLHAAFRVLNLWLPPKSEADDDIAKRPGSQLDFDKLIEVPPHKFLPILPQLLARLGEFGNDAQVERVIMDEVVDLSACLPEEVTERHLAEFVYRIILSHPHRTIWGLLAVAQADGLRASLGLGLVAEKDAQLDASTNTGLYKKATTNKANIARSILARLYGRRSAPYVPGLKDRVEHNARSRQYLKEMIHQTVNASEAYIEVATIPNPSSLQLHESLKIIGGVRDRCTMVPIPTVPLRTAIRDIMWEHDDASTPTEEEQLLFGPTTPGGTAVECIQHILPAISLPGGVSAPKVLTCMSTTGLLCRQLAKPKDDTRQDLIFEQVFGLTNALLATSGSQSLTGSGTSSTRNRAPPGALNIRTYTVVPLAPLIGLLQFVDNTMTISSFLTGPTKMGDGILETPGAHTRYFPNDKSFGDARAEQSLITQKHGSAKNDPSVLALVVAQFATLCSQFTPCMHYFFYEYFGTTQQWLEARSRYALSTAAVSMVGYFLGLGDRHTSNIMIDYRSGETVHIDFGIAFDKGTLLKIPETVPFRLTRDIIDGFGIQGASGEFKSGCEKITRVMRDRRVLLQTVLEAFIYDPLVRWSLDVDNIKKVDDASRQSVRVAAQQVGDAGVKPKSKPSAIDAQRALTRVEGRLKGMDGSELLSVETHVKRVIHQATDPTRLSGLFAGWAPFV